MLSSAKCDIDSLKDCIVKEEQCDTLKFNAHIIPKTLFSTWENEKVSPFVNSGKITLSMILHPGKAISVSFIS